MKFKGKIDLWFWAVYLLGSALFLWEIIASRELSAADLIALIVYQLIFLPILIRNYVELQENKVTMVFGILKDSIAISEITQVYSTHNPIASTSASLDRIVLRGRRQSLICSVCEKKEFFEELKKRNPEIHFQRG